MLTKLKKNKIDWSLFIALIILIILGTISFLSASLGKLASDTNEFIPFIKNQLFFIYVIGSIAFLIGIILNYKYYKKFSLIIFALLLLFSLTVFIPSLNFEHQGGVRWINLFGFSAQPSEFLKFGSIVFIAFFATYRKKFPDKFKYQILPFIIFAIIIATILLTQKDFGTLFTILFPAFLILYASGIKTKQVAFLAIIAIIGFGVLVAFRPYMLGRIKTFVNPDRDLLGASYQSNQALIAIGSGEVFGRGLGQSIQKFSHYLPEQATDSIFAVYSEELGFVGGVILLLLYLFIIVRSINIAKSSNDIYAKFLIIGIISTFTIQICLNILSTLHWAPVSGVPLPFFSKGGTSLVITLFMFGIILNISKYRVRI